MNIVQTIIDMFDLWFGFFPGWFTVLMLAGGISFIALCAAKMVKGIFSIFF